MIRNIRQRTRNRLSSQENSPTLPQISHGGPPNPLRSRKRKRRYLLPKVLLSLVLLQYYAIPLLFGEHPLHGGYLGMLIDIRIRKYLWNQKLKAATKEALDWGLEIPNAQTKARTTNVPHAVILELIHRNVRRKELLHEFEQYQSYPGQKGNSRKTPRIILRQKDVWSRPIATSTPGLIEVDLDESDMDSYIQRFEKNDNRTSDTFHQLERRAKDEFFFILFLSRHGGVYTNPFGNHDDHKKLLRWIESLDTATNDPQRGWVIIKDGILQSLIVPPNNEFLTCIKETSTDELKHSNVGMSSFHAIINEIASKDTDWNGNSKGFITLPQECTGINRLNFTRGSSNDPLTHQNRYRNMPVKEISVSISATNEPKPEYAHKTTIDQLLSRQSRFCQNLWIWPCHRCLKSALHGSYAKCSLFCGSCSDHMHAKEKIRSDDSTVQVNVDVSGYRVDGKTQMIPRIIHQTWFEDITPLHYPNLNRLQNSWKNSGWTYKFYTDDSARQYINDHFPNHFLQAYDALIPGAYKADLFRYMILMREGGVYADVDVLLDASLDTFVTPTMSFFAPRDAVAEYADGQYCLWNGLIGAAPGHQIIVRAVERLVNLILNRADILDLEKDVAQKAGIETETWKIRAVQELLLSGPCALGIATNEVLGKDPVARFDVGWVNSTTDIGDSMILMLDKEDMNAMRFTDVERNILFASTDMPGVNKDRLKRGTITQKMRSKHYSNSGKGFWLWGTNGVYKNDLVSKKTIFINTRYL